MKRVLAFLARCFADTTFYGTVTVRFKGGVLGRITVERDYLEETVPTV